MPAEGLTFHGERPVLIYFHGGGFFVSEDAGPEIALLFKKWNLRYVLRIGWR